jgi:hypothetical protein
VTNKELYMGRLDTIATRQRSGRARDLVFAVFIALVGAISLTAVGVAGQTAITAHVAHK